MLQFAEIRKCTERMDLRDEIRNFDTDNDKHESLGSLVSEIEEKLKKESEQLEKQVAEESRRSSNKPPTPFQTVSQMIRKEKEMKMGKVDPDQKLLTNFISTTPKKQKAHDVSDSDSESSDIDSSSSLQRCESSNIINSDETHFSKETSPSDLSPSTAKIKTEILNLPGNDTHRSKTKESERSFAVPDMKRESDITSKCKTERSNLIHEITSSEIKTESSDDINCFNHFKNIVKDESKKTVIKNKMTELFGEDRSKDSYGESSDELRQRHSFVAAGAAASPARKQKSVLKRKFSELFGSTSPVDSGNDTSNKTTHNYTRGIAAEGIHPNKKQKIRVEIVSKENVESTVKYDKNSLTNTVIKHLMPHYKAKKIASKDLFKLVARQIVHRILKDKLHQMGE